MQNLKSKEDDVQQRNQHYEKVCVQKKPLFEDDSYQLLAHGQNNEITSEDVQPIQSSKCQRLDQFGHMKDQHFGLHPY